MTEPLGSTPSQTVGPFLAIALPWPDGPDVVPAGSAESGDSGDSGATIRIVGRVVDGAGEPVPDGLIEIWSADRNGHFAHPGDPRGAEVDAGFRGFGRCATDENGEYWFRTVKPGRVDDQQAPHIDVTVFARGLLRHLVTRLYFPDEPEANASDPVLLTLDESDRAALTAADTGDALRFDIRLQGEGETPFFAV